MDIIQPPTNEGLKNASNVWEWIVFFAGLIGLGCWTGWKASKTDSRVDAMEEKLSDIHDQEYLPRKEFDNLQKQCQEHTWDKFLLALEKRDREFDRKFAVICHGISAIKAEVKR